MTTRRTLLLGLTYLATCALADVTYNVVGYPDSETGSFGVQLLTSPNGPITKLTTSTTTFPLWSAIVLGASATTPYKYVKLDSAGNPILFENFTRTLQDPTAIQTVYEVFEREVTDTVVPLVPLVYEPWEMSKTKVFDDGVVATIHLTGDAGLWEGMLMQPEKAQPMQVDFRYINDKLVHSVQNITVGVSGKSSMEFNKQALKLEFDTKSPQNQTFFSRPSVKLRSESSDPTMIREKLYIDVLNAVGVPTQQGSWVRVYMNSKAVGLYLMVDDVGSSFLKQTIHHGDGNVVKGSLWQMNAPMVETQGDLRYLGPTAGIYPADCYKMKTLGSNPVDAPMTQLIQLMKDLADFDPLTMNGGQFWESRLDVDGFLRNMAMEYLAGSWDAYWWSGSNYFIYFNPTLGTTGKWQWISTDFDGTFGDGDPTEILTTYQTYADFSAHDRPMISKLILGSPDLNKQFEQTLRDIVSYAFKPEALFPRIEAYEKMLEKDVAWDYSIDRSGYPGKTNSWTVEDFHKSLAMGGVKDMNLGVRYWIEERMKGLEAQLDFKVVPGTPDRVTRVMRKSKGGASDVDAFIASGAAPGSSFRAVGGSGGVGRLVVMTVVGAVLAALL
ncbi:coth protein-domain-containing protein [Linnemannia elongata]|nr:coth protein-domain-containing protein [Linnemannia elongata]